MKPIQRSKKLLFIPLFTLLLLSCDKYGITTFTLTVTNPAPENVTISIEDFVNYVAPNDAKKMKVKIAGYTGETFNLEAVINESGNKSIIDIANFVPIDGRSYTYTVGTSTVDEVAGSGDTDELVGKWMRTSGCVNADGNSNYYQFNADGTGYFFAADCTSACLYFGIYFYFDYTSTASMINLMNTSTSDYCGITNDTPPDESVTYSLSGDFLTVGSNTYERQ